MVPPLIIHITSAASEYINIYLNSLRLCRVPFYHILTLLFTKAASGMTTISETVKKDHREIEGYYDQIVNASTRDQERYQTQFTWELARHSIGEDLVVYPAFERAPR